MIGFLIGGVALPVVSIITIALSGTDMLRPRQPSRQALLGLVFSVLVYLSIGAFFGLPRTAAVSFSTAVAPLIGTQSLVASVIFCLVFFGIAFYLCWTPATLIDTTRQDTHPHSAGASHPACVPLPRFVAGFPRRADGRIHEHSPGRRLA